MSIRLASLLVLLGALGACSMPSVRHASAPPATTAAVGAPAVENPAPVRASTPPSSESGSVREAVPAAVVAAPVVPAHTPPPEPTAVVVDSPSADAPAPEAPAPVAQHVAPSAEKPLAAAAPVPVASRLEIRGRVNLTAGSRQPLAPGDAANTVVYFVPIQGGERARTGDYTVYTHNRDFSPQALVIPEGSKVTFINLDDVRHNVFSVSPGSSFDLGYQSAGAKAAHRFGHSGLVLVSCHVHHAMELDMLVLPTPYATRTAADGSFNLRGLPPGPGTLHFWNPRSQPQIRRVSLPLGKPVLQALKATHLPMTTQFNLGAPA